MSESQTKTDDPQGDFRTAVENEAWGEAIKYIPPMLDDFDDELDRKDALKASAAELRQDPSITPQEREQAEALIGASQQVEESIMNVAKMAKNILSGEENQQQILNLIDAKEEALQELEAAARQLETTDVANEAGYSITADAESVTVVPAGETKEKTVTVQNTGFDSAENVEVSVDADPLVVTNGSEHSIGTLEVEGKSLIHLNVSTAESVHGTPVPSGLYTVTVDVSVNGEIVTTVSSKVRAADKFRCLSEADDKINSFDSTVDNLSGSLDYNRNLRKRAGWVESDINDQIAAYRKNDGSHNTEFSAHIIDDRVFWLRLYVDAEDNLSERNRQVLIDQLEELKAIVRLADDADTCYLKSAKQTYNQARKLIREAGSNQSLADGMSDQIENMNELGRTIATGGSTSEIESDFRNLINHGIPPTKRYINLDWDLSDSEKEQATDLVDETIRQLEHAKSDYL
ncbi:COG1361 family protein [Halococcoides cellulosivorans]|uniref:CARDB domain-containing protein n=1 Tax=Halococcoides cellulosivorans TaxID=1679096 RepID=A0A2R4X3A3_9EURY|nr:hypothetical protein [Halococcoides cellulosivorans]AWB28274.1 hypothetical protein HARCEL1_11450 [Halococcoides cellulosivorans]